ncbi:hypothetical protein B0H11DRAFT_1761918 [Mycena galericulata]|nr:hypothetical protein B0H11DRAFT_1761918 [Mycena galericulata]
MLNGYQVCGRQGQRVRIRFLYFQDPLILGVETISLSNVIDGPDGSIHFWDKAFEAAPGPISTTAFNRNGFIFAYAVSYDWSKVHSGGMTPGHPNKLRVMLHTRKDE